MSVDNSKASSLAVTKDTTERRTGRPPERTTTAVRSEPMNRRDFLLVGGAAALAAACAPNRRPDTQAATTGPAPAGARGSTTAVTGEAATTSAPADPSSPAPIATEAPVGAAAFVQHGSRDRRQVALTFHANGDIGLTDQLLAEAERAGVPLTIFAVGSWLDANPAQAARILKGGHELANHTYTHPSLGNLSASAVLTEITKCRDVLARLTGAPAKWFRASGIDVPTERILVEAGKAGYATAVGFDVDPLDYQDPGSSLVVSRVTAKLAPGAIVSMHMGHAGTVAALPMIIDSLNAAGLKPVTVSTLLA